MGAIASQITSLTIVFSIVYLDTDQRKHQSSASLAFVRGIHRRPGNSPHKWPVTRKMFPFDDVIMCDSGTACKETSQTWVDETSKRGPLRDRHTDTDLIHKSQNAPVPYPAMLHSKQKCAHFCSEWSIAGYGTSAFWNLWNWSIGRFHWYRR